VLFVPASPEWQAAQPTSGRLNTSAPSVISSCSSAFGTGVSVRREPST
jgi:hypothetical protein